jgi:hypothetical protein
METKQTAVQLILDKFSLLSDGDFKYWMINNYDELIEMEREQIEDAYWLGGQDVPYSAKQCEQYYEQTYGEKFGENYGGQDE